MRHLRVKRIKKKLYIYFNEWAYKIFLYFEKNILLFEEWNDSPENWLLSHFSNFEIMTLSELYFDQIF